MSQTVLDFESARAQRDAGMQCALDHAADLCFDWPERAYAFLLDFAKYNATFQSEDVSDASKQVRGFVQPPTDRAWGAIYTKAVRNGVIEHHGVARSRRRHASICILWRSLVFRGSAA